MKAQRGVDLVDEVNRIECPTLIVHGDADTTVPIAFGQALASSTPGADFVWLRGVGHGLIADREALRITQKWLLGSKLRYSSAKVEGTGIQ